MVQLHALKHNDLGRRFASAVLAREHLVHGVDPFVSASGVNFVRPQHGALATVGVEAPCVAVAGACRIRLPRFLQLIAPAGAELLVKVDAAAEVGALGDERQRFVARCVKAPRRDDLLRNMRAAGAQPFNGIVR